MVGLSALTQPVRRLPMELTQTTMVIFGANLNTVLQTYFMISVGTAKYPFNDQIMRLTTFDRRDGLAMLCSRILGTAGLLTVRQIFATLVLSATANERMSTEAQQEVKPTDFHF